MSENLFPRNVNYEELLKLNEAINSLMQSVEEQQLYIKKIPDNVHHSVEESSESNVIPKINNFTHDEITSMYYHIQTSMNDEYKKQAKKIEQIMEEKMKNSIAAQHRMIVGSMNEILEKEKEKQKKAEKITMLNIILSGVSVVLLLICIILLAI